MTFGARYRVACEAYQAGDLATAYAHFLILAADPQADRMAIASYGWIRGVLATKGARVKEMLERMPPLGAI